jgi:hypothetical protein
MKGGLQTPPFRLEADSQPKPKFDALCHPYLFDETTMSGCSLRSHLHVAIDR